MTDENLDFNLENDYTPLPLVPAGKYAGAVTKVTFNDEINCLTFTVVLNGNGGYCSDDETEIDGRSLPLKVWYPKDGDGDEMTKSGLQTKRQWKINNIAKVAKKLGINLNTMSDMYEGVESGEWIGLEVSAKVSVEPADDFNDEAYNDIKTLEAAE